MVLIMPRDTEAMLQEKVRTLKEEIGSYRTIGLLSDTGEPIEPNMVL
jgi:hypothetical protein